MSTSVSSHTFCGLTLSLGQGKSSLFLNLARNLLEKAICLPRVNQVYAQAASAPDQWQFLSSLLQALEVRYELGDGDLKRIPAQGPLVVVANHPFGGVEGIILPELLGRVRPDVKILANGLLRPVRELQDLFIYVDPFGGKNSARVNLAGLREALTWLRQGGALGIFPAGEVSHLRWPDLRITDPVWHRSVAHLIRKSQAQTLPVFFAGSNSPLFQCLGLIHPLLRTALLPREALNKKGKVIQVKIGRVIGPTKVEALANEAEVMAYLRLRTYLLQGNFPGRSLKAGFRSSGIFQTKPAPEPIVASPPQADLVQEINNLPTSQTLVESGRQAVYYATAAQIPWLLQEIGRLRELTFRQVQEGTGQAIDLDRFDSHYLHLFLWNREAGEVVGAYRLGESDRIMAAKGRDGLYTATLFDYQEQFLQKISPALELGRSFIRAEYQKNYSALLLLWRGIGQFVVRNPHYRVLFGPVSISQEYNEFSQGLLAAWLSLHTFLPELARYIRPRQPLSSPYAWDQELRLILAGAQDVDELSALIAEVDPKQKGIPVLLKQYLKLGGKLLGFNRDPLFNNALDGLILVDLWQTPAQVLQRYMGAAGWAAYERQRATAISPAGSRHWWPEAGLGLPV